MGGLSRRDRIWVPTFSPEVRGWARRYIARNQWRTAPLYDGEDLYQEAFIVFAMIRDKYPDVVDPPHFMRLFQVSLVNRIHDLANARTRERRVDAVVVDDDGNTCQLIDVLPDRRGSAVPYDAMPHALYRMMEGACESPRPRTHRRMKGGRRMTTNQFMCALAGVPESVDMRERFRLFVGDHC